MEQISVMFSTNLPAHPDPETLSQSQTSNKRACDRNFTFQMDPASVGDSLLHGTYFGVLNAVESQVSFAKLMFPKVTNLEHKIPVFA